MRNLLYTFFHATYDFHGIVATAPLFLEEFLAR